MAAQINPAVGMTAEKRPHATRLLGQNARGRIVAEPDRIQAAAVFDPPDQLPDLGNLGRVEDADKVERAARTRIQARVDAYEGVRFGALGDLVGVGFGVALALDRVVQVKVLVRTQVGHIKVICETQNSIVSNVGV